MQPHAAGTDTDRFEDAALIVAAHGSTRRPSANRHVLTLVEAIRTRRLFASTDSAFLLGEAADGDLRPAPAAKRIVLVPFMMADGFLVEKLAAGLRASLSSDGAPRPLHAAPPIGTLPEIAEIAAELGAEALQRQGGHAAGDAALVLVAHGSSSRPESRQGAAQHASAVRALKRFRSVHLALLEEPPSLSEILRDVDGPAAVVGLFAAPGGHALDDVAAEIAASGKTNVYDAGPVGLSPRMIDLVIDSAARALAARP